MQKVEFKIVDVAGNEELQSLFGEASQSVQPSFAFPQIYAKGKIVSGLDMIKDMLEVRVNSLFLIESRSELMVAIYRVEMKLTRSWLCSSLPDHSHLHGIQDQEQIPPLLHHMSNPFPPE